MTNPTIDQDHDMRMIGEQHRNRKTYGSHWNLSFRSLLKNMYK